ncbi:5'/3'-nucleotidase sure [Dendrothele bispora CBS 962.96]|uniref:5'/3'-nucleotidase sure n=1 Tax=Dendrothele bispora (strain CBS 962.96) TaxID=1314807 RepID=A0A4S8KVB3_DENBC|nr:5'/3'-nucleotidase sure [Dendrothele bispora CBS 962.96]THV04556.1 5'/3'-nucleotidase sure [Dendrothele bispora CBS 962.96]
MKGFGLLAFLASSLAFVSAESDHHGGGNGQGHGDQTKLNILLTNDDSWASANIRATYDALKSDGHNVLLVGPAVQQSGKGGTVVLPTTNITAPGGEFGSIPVGAPFFGHDEQDQNLWYFNGTPAATAIFALDIIIPMVMGDEKIDLVVSGPNEGQNAGPFLYTLSGTIGATYASVERGIPAVAFSAGNETHRSFTTITGDPHDPATIAGRLTANFVAALANGINPKKQRLLPLGVGIGINYPVFGPGNPCVDPPFTLTRMTGGADIDQLHLDPTTGFPVFENLVAPGLNTPINGRKDLPGETPIAAQCKTSVSVFSVDYDAPTGVAAPVQNHLHPLFGKSSL